MIIHAIYINRARERETERNRRPNRKEAGRRSKTDDRNGLKHFVVRFV